MISIPTLRSLIPTLRPAVVGIVLGAGIFQAQAVPFLDEGFDYNLPDGASLSGSDGGLGWSGSWSSKSAYTSTSLTHPLVSSIGGAGHPTATWNTARPFDITGRTVAGQVQWTSFLIEPSGNGRLLMFSGGSSNQGFGIDFSSTSTELMVGGSTSNTSVPWATGTNLVILKSTWSSGNNVTLQFWLNPADVTDEAALGTPALTKTSSGSISVGAGIFPRGKNTFVFDEVRMGDSLGDVLDSLSSLQIAARFLHQATFGATYDEIVALADQIDQQGEATALEAWIDTQVSLPSTPLMDTIVAKMPLDWHTNGHSAAWTSAWLTDAVREPDQLRGRLNYVLHQIFVIGNDRGARVKNGNVDYYDMLGEHAYGNYRDLLFDVSMHVHMGKWLSHYKNVKADPALGSNPDENYAREVMQLFSIGLFMLNQDGTRMVDGNGDSIETYTNEQITEFAEVFTGLGGEKLQYWHTPFNGPTDPFEPMYVYDDYHDTSTKVLLDYPGAANGGVAPAFVDDPNVEQEGLADINFAIDNLFNHPNVGPFIGRLLIQHMVTSNPTPGYLSRVASAFADNGQGVRGDMVAVVKAILLDPEARSVAMLNDTGHGRLDEQWLRSVRLGRKLDVYSNDPNIDYFQVYGKNRGSRDYIFGIEPMRAPSVFNWFQPDYQPFGDIADAGLFGPEFQVYDDFNIAKTANGIKEITEFSWPGFGDNTTIDLTALLDLLATNGESALIDRLDLVFCRGLMSPDTRTILANALTQVSDSVEKVQLAIYLVTTSTEFAVMR